MSKSFSQPDSFWQEAEDFGIDTSLLRLNQSLSYEERALNHQKALDLLLALREAKARYDESRRADSDSAKE